MKFRVVLHEDGLYRVQYRNGWWCRWVTDRCLSWKTPSGPRGIPVPRFTETHSTRAKAIQRVEYLKELVRPKKQEVVYTDP